MADPILCEGVREGVLSGLTAGDLAGALMRLSTANIVYDKNTVIGDLVSPAFTGYATSSAITWSVPYTAPDGRLVTAGSHKSFVCTGGSPSDLLYAAGVVDAMNMTLLAVIPFDSPIPIAAVGDGVTVECTIPYGA